MTSHEISDRYLIKLSFAELFDMKIENLFDNRKIKPVNLYQFILDHKLFIFLLFNSFIISQIHQ